MNNLQQTLDRAEQKCSNHGARLTTKRKQVLSGLLQSKKALSAYELVDFYKLTFDESIPPMSMYRILEFLQHEGLVHKLNLANKYVACAHIACSHDHEVSHFLICISCQKVKEVSVSKVMVAQVKQKVTQAGFHLLSPEIEMNCICLSCKAKAL